MSTSYEKDPDAVVDYQIDWTDWLQVGEQIYDSRWTICGVCAGTVMTDPLTFVDDDEVGTATTTVATIWVEGGVAWRSYRLTNHIATNQNRYNDQSLIIRVRQK